MLRLFEAATSLVDEKRKTRSSDASMVQWLVHQVRERGAKAMADLLVSQANYANGYLPLFDAASICAPQGTCVNGGDKMYQNGGEIMYQSRYRE